MISKLSLNIAKTTIWFGHAFQVIPCSWNSKKRRYRTDTSKLNSGLRTCQMLGRVFTIFWFTFIYYVYTKQQLTNWETFTCIGGILLALTSIPAHVFTLKAPRYLPVILNGVFGLNKRIEEKYRQLNIVPEENHLTTILLVTICSAAFVMFATPVMYFALLLDVKLVECTAEILVWLCPIEISKLSMKAFLCLATEGVLANEVLLWLPYVHETLLCNQLIKDGLRFYIWSSDLKSHSQRMSSIRLIFRQLQYLHRFRLDEALSKEDLLFFFFFVNLLLAVISFYAVKLLHSSSSSSTSQCLLPFLVFWVVLFVYFMQLAFKCCTTVTDESIRFKRTYSENPKFNRRKLDKAFIRSCPHFVYEIGHCLPVNSKTFVVLMKEFTISCFITLVVSYKEF